MLPLLWTNLIHLGAALLGAVALLALLGRQERACGRYLAHVLGWRAVLVTGWLGVPVHELSHLLFALLFGHRIVGWKLFDPDPVSGTLGYVRHAYTRRTAWQLLGYFFIAVAPALVGCALLLLILWSMVSSEALVEALGRASLLARLPLFERPAESLWQAAGELQTIATGLGLAIWGRRSPWLPLQLYLAVCVASHLAPRRADCASATPGLVVAAALALSAAALCAWFGVPLAAGVAALIPAAALVALVGAFQGLYVGAVALLTRSQRRGVALSS